MRKQMNELRFLVCGALIVCAALFVIAPAAQAGNTIDPGDNHYSVSNASFNFSSTGCSPPIPADFFGPGSDPFEGQIHCEGDSSNNDFDAILRRMASGDVTPPYPAVDLIPIEIVELSLVSTAPITVTYNGGQNPESWDVEVDLSPNPISPAPAGTMNVTKTHPNGGVFQIELHVQPRFTFTKVSNPVQVEIWDTGLAAITPTQYNDAAPYPWVVPPTGNGLDPSGNYPLGLNGGGGCTLTLVPKNFLIKFQQLPLNGPQYFGHDELSTAYVDTDINTHFTGCYMADDFADLVDAPVIKIKWWGSYIENVIMEPISRFLIAFEGDVPAIGQPGDAGHIPSHPDQVILSQFVHLAAATPLNPGEYSETLLNSGGPPCNEALFEYEAVLENPFPQDPNTVYWIKIVAIVDDFAAWNRLLPAAQNSGFALCEFLKLPYAIQAPYGLDVPVTRWGWHNRDYTIMDPYASTAPAVDPGENKIGSVQYSDGTDVDVWHFQDDAVSGHVYIDEVEGEMPVVNQPTWMEEYYKYFLLYCTGQGGVDGPVDIEQYSKDLAFELWTIEEEPLYEWDFGDAPDPLDATAGEYPTLLINDGARHIIVAGAPFFGPDGDEPDAETDGQPNVAATGDDIDLAGPSGGDDEDGVTLVPLVIGVAVPITFEVNGGGGNVSAWIDFNGDGDWLDFGEGILTGVAYAPGIHVIMVTAPAGSTVGLTYVRFRITTAGYVPSYGPAVDGEVEDHTVVIEEQTDPVLKFQQLPLNGPEYFGHDEFSTAYSWFDPVGDPMGYLGCYMADDFADLADTPVINIKWWGSYLENLYEIPVQKFLIAFEEDIPAVGELGDPDYEPSHPGQVLQSEIVNVSDGTAALNPGEFSETYVSSGGLPCNEDLYEYEAVLKNPFPQEPNTVYWIKIVALVDIDPMISMLLEQCGLQPCDLGYMSWQELIVRCPELQTYPPITKWGWHNRDYTIMDPYASTAPAVYPGEGIMGSVLYPDGIDVAVWHFQDDAVSGEVYIDIMDDAYIYIDQYSWMEEYYKYWLPFCSAAGVDGPYEIEYYSKDLAFELWTIGEEPHYEWDFGDAPDPLDATAGEYPTLLINDGARHIIVAGAPFFGPDGDEPDAETDGQPNVAADGDDINLLGEPGYDDEDGVTITGPLLVGVAVPITFEVNDGPGDVSAWIDYNRNGVFDDPGETILSGVTYASGTYALPAIVPVAPASVLGDTYVRFRITTSGALVPSGPASDGEVEDHVVCIKARDFGDALDNAAVPGYPTLLAHPLVGASHVIGGPFLGPNDDSPDAELDGQPNIGATGDDIDLAGPSGGDDEDGVTLVPLVIGVAVPVTFEVNGGGGDVSAWIDFNGDGDWLDAGEEILTGVAYAPGVHVVMVTAPAGSTVGTTYVRFRITTAGYVPSYGPADDGEVEDHTVVIEEEEEVNLMPKFRQLPQNGPDYFGHDELSTMYLSFDQTGGPTGFEGCYMADDFADNRNDPVIRLKWWGSYMENVHEENDVTTFLIVFETDVPAGTDLPYSHPGTVILSQEVTLNGSDPTALSPGQFSELYVGPGGPPCGEDLYEYEAYLEIPFDQEAHTVYWVKIVAIMDVGPDNWLILKAAADQYTGGLCELLNKPWQFIWDNTGVSVPRWGWHNRDYTVTNPYASKQVTPGEFLDGTVVHPTPGDVDIWHFQDDAVSGDITVDMAGDISQPTYFDEYYKYIWPLCTGTGVDGPFEIQFYSKDLAFELLTTECLTPTTAIHPTTFYDNGINPGTTDRRGTSYYQYWLDAGRPECWCSPRQCHGDADGKKVGDEWTGMIYVNPDDLNPLLAGWLVYEPNPTNPWGPAGPGLDGITDLKGTPAICADFDHFTVGDTWTGMIRLNPGDLNILLSTWLVYEPNPTNPWGPAGPGVPADCGGTVNP